MTQTPDLEPRPTRKAPPENAERPSRSGGRSRPVSDIRAARPRGLGWRSLRSVARRTLSVGSLFALDAAGLALGVYLTLAARELWVGNTPILWGALWQAFATLFPFLVLVTVLVFWQQGLYARREVRAGFARVPAALIVVGLLTLAFAAGTGHRFSTYLLFPTAIAITTITIGVMRACYETITATLWNRVGLRRRAVLMGEARDIERLRSVLDVQRGGIEYAIAGYVGPGDVEGPLKRLGGAAELDDVLCDFDVDELIVSDSDVTERQLLDIVAVAHRRGVRVNVAPTTTEILERRAQYIPGQAVPLFELRPPVFVGVDWLVKRAFDVVVSVALLVIALPLWLLIALAIRLDSSGPALYRSRRVGLGETGFDMVKFRTMRSGAAALQAELEGANEADGPLFKIRDDPRVTRVGRLLRTYSLDEIPNLLNVLRGEMSLVGPRPLPLRDYELLEDWHRKRYLVLPGMTGLWQISGRSDLGFDELVRLDFYYLDHWSIWLDVQIMLKTIPSVLARRGAY
jgi:exopolysaccharide biosynthesis polyprenyl glycosylphosphotransferase